MRIHAATLYTPRGLESDRVLTIEDGVIRSIELEGPTEVVKIYEI